ncbi:hypothetical protein PENTCL1PPCAC_27872, partial [Pristionchus entomophagus]
KKGKAEIWEKGVIDILKEYSQSAVNVDFITERSIEEEKNTGSQLDLLPIAVGYLLMAIYLILALPQFSYGKMSPLWGQAMPGVMVCVTIAASVLSVSALYGIFGVPATMMCWLVLLFLLLVIGVNNTIMFVRIF